MARSHALSGTAAYLALVPVLPADARPVEAVTLGTLAAAAAAIAPDIDHPGSTVARSLGPLTRALSAVVAAVAGGHRGATHSLLGVAAATAGAAACVAAGGWWAAGLLAGIALVAGLALGSDHLQAAAVLVAAGGAAGYSAAMLHLVPMSVVPLAVACGYAAHLVGDDLTHSRVRWLWPLAWRRPAVFTLRTGGPLERWVIAPALALVTVWLLTERIGATPYLTALYAAVSA